MKKIIYGVSAAALAIGGFAFTKASNLKPTQSYYYFDYTAAGNDLIKPTSIPLYTSVNPYNCPTGTDLKCARWATSYVPVSGGYAPSGTADNIKKSAL